MIACFIAGIVIVGEETVGRYDLGIFVASIVPGGPADKDGRIRTGAETMDCLKFALALYHFFCVYGYLGKQGLSVN